ncbi:MAG: beta-galactosidase [Planctomycetaceae bacterium]|nr:beta-galactosidase [Planctomycetaceae bacterium]
MSKKFCCVYFLFIFLFFFNNFLNNFLNNLPAAETVRVDVTNGVPRILVDGQPVRARMFFGNPGSLPIAVGTEAQRLAFEFQPVESEPKSATMHIRFGNKSAVIAFDDLLLEELDVEGKPVRNVFGCYRFENGMDDFKNDWTFWQPAGEMNTVGNVTVEPKAGADNSNAMIVRLTAPKTGKFPDFHVYHHPNLVLDKTKKYRLSFWIKSDVPTSLRIAFYRPETNFIYLGGINADFFRNQIKLAGEAGAKFVSFSTMLPWTPPGKEVNWNAVDDSCRRVLAANPDALLIPRIPMDPPAWWVDANPGDVITWKGTPHDSRKVAAVSSMKYRKEAAERLDALVRHLEENFGTNMGGYHPVGQNTGEWFYQDSWGPALNGYAEADTTAWRIWLENRYKNDQALQTAWGNNSATLSTAEIPLPELRTSKTGGVFRDVAVEKAQQIVLDFVEFQQEMMIDTVLAFAKTTRNASNGKRLVVIFYGYVFEFGALSTGPATSGHYALRKALASPDVDIYCSPISYFDRKAGGSAAAMTAAESVALSGKLWLYEDDTRTYLTPEFQLSFPGWQDGGTTFEATRQLLLRNTAECAVRHFGTWWMDLGAGGWFDDPKLWAEMKRLETIDNLFLETPVPFQPEVAVFLNESSLLSVAAGGNVMSVPAVHKIREPLARMGTPYGQYLLDDFLNGKVHAKLNVFAAAWRLSESQRKLLKQQSAKAGTVNIWCFAPGFLDTEKGGSTETINELTGFKTKLIAGVNAWAEPTEIGKSLGLENGFGIKNPVKPLFSVTDAKPEETLAVYSDGSAAVVMRRGESGETSIFSGVPGVSSELLRLAAKKSGVHLYTNRDCNVYANGSAIVLHGSADGSVNVNFGKPVTIIDLLDGSTVGKGSVLTIPLKLGETRVLKMQEEKY